MELTAKQKELIEYIRKCENPETELRACKYGHIGCATTERGRCYNEALADLNDSGFVGSID